VTTPPKPDLNDLLAHLDDISYNIEALCLALADLNKVNFFAAGVAAARIKAAVERARELVDGLVE